MRILLRPSRIATLIARSCLVLMTVAVHGAAAAQSQGGRIGGGMGRGFVRPNFDPVLFNGPPTPEDMVDLVHLEAAQYENYAGQYRVFMEETRAVRDSVLEERHKMREAMGPVGEPTEREEYRGGMEGRRSAMEALQKQLQALEQKQKAFDDNLKKALTEDQLKKYEAWRRDERARAEREMTEMMGGRPPG